MKKSITKEQWDELSDKEKKIYGNWELGRKMDKGTDYPNIYDMIEFLEDNDEPNLCELEIKIEKGDWECFHGWEVHVYRNELEKCVSCGKPLKQKVWFGQGWDSLCDALWMAVKHKLQSYKEDIN